MDSLLTLHKSHVPVEVYFSSGTIELCSSREQSAHNDLPLHHLHASPSSPGACVLSLSPRHVSALLPELSEVAGGRPVHTIIRQSTYYQSICRILQSSTTCHLTLAAAAAALQPNASLARGCARTMTHLSEMPQTSQLPNYEVNRNVCKGLGLLFL